MSTPLVAGAAAVTRQYVLSRLNSPSAALIKAVLLNTAFDMYPGQYGEIGADKGQELLKHAPNIDEGFGRVDVENLLAAHLVYLDEKEGVATGETKSYDVAGNVQKITMVYNDYPASPAASMALVNNVDLEVQVAGRTIKSESGVDNSRQITLDSSLSGPVKINVIGTSVPMGKNNRQPFAIVYSLSH
jgi:hypothetical protein